MRAFGKACGQRTVLAVAGAAMALGATGCGGSDFANKPRPAAPIELTGVIQPKKVTISPNRVGAGPVEITISNQTPDAHTVTLEGGSISERAGPVEPQGTATIQKTLPEGTYTVRAGSEQAAPRQIAPAKLTIGKPRPSSSGELLQP